MEQKKSKKDGLDVLAVGKVGQKQNMEEGRGLKETLADKSLDFENHGPSCVQEDLANLEMVKIFLCSLCYNKIFLFSIDLKFSLLPVLHLLPYLQKKNSIRFQQ